MNHLIPSVCALVLATGSSCFAGWVCQPCYTEPDPCLKPLKVRCGCYDAYREPYRISYPRLCPQRLVFVGNTQGALAMRREAVLRQREMLAFERSLLDASSTITQPATGTALFGSTEGASVVENPYAVIPPQPPYPGPGPTRIVRTPLNPVGEQIPVGVFVPGKPGFVYCPFGSNGYIDIRGLAPGSLARDPYTGRTFRVP